MNKPYEFFGALVVSSDVKVGWNGDSSYCNLDLVEDPDNNKMFNPPKIGTPCMFSMDGVNIFGGIYKRYRESESVSNGRRFQVTLESPDNILQGTLIVLGEFQGTVYLDDNNLLDMSKKPVMTYGGDYPTNLINVFADKENFEKGGVFGAANLNILGYKTLNIFEDIKACIDRGVFGGPVEFYGNLYNFDFSELSAIAKTLGEYRVEGNQIFLNALIEDICSTAIYDYMTILTGDADENGIITDNLKVSIKAISRASQPEPGYIKNYINELKARSAKEKTLVSYDYGVELVDSVPRQKVIIGSNASRYWLAGRGNIFPIWGQLGTQGQGSTYHLGNSLNDYDDPFAKIYVTLDGGYTGSFTKFETTLLELRCAMSGRKCWTAYQILSSIRSGQKNITIGNIKINPDEVEDLFNGDLVPSDIMNTDIGDGEYIASFLYGNADAQRIAAQRFVESRFNALKQVASNIYGKWFMVAVPSEPGGTANTYRWIDSEKRQEDAWELSDSAWAGDGADDFFPDNKFFDENYKLKPVAVHSYYEDWDYSELSTEYCRSPYGINYGVASPAAVDREWGIQWVTMQLANKKDSRGNLITTDYSFGLAKVEVKPVYRPDQYTSQFGGFNALCSLLFERKLNPSYHNMYGLSNYDFSFLPSCSPPEYIGIPQQSNRYVWGPWFGSKGGGGVIEMKTIPEFAPENFGSTKAMNDAANDIVKIELTINDDVESANLEIAETPRFSIAERFMESGPYVTGLNLRMGIDGWTTSYEMSSWTKQFGKLANWSLKNFIQQRRSIFQFQKMFRDLFRRKPYTRSLMSNISMLERYNPPVPGVQFLGFSFARLLSDAANESKLGPALDAHFVNVENAINSLGMNPVENFGAGLDQLFSPVFSYRPGQETKIREQFNNDVQDMKARQAPKEETNE